MTPLRFFDFELDPATGELWRRGHTVPLERQPAIALACLASHAGRLVTRDELRRAIWPDGVHVDFERGMNYCIRQLRAALGDEAREPVFIETIPRRGYRFIAPMQRQAPVVLAIRASRYSDQRNSTAPTVKPAPTDASSTRSPFLTRP